MLDEKEIKIGERVFKLRQLSFLKNIELSKYESKDERLLNTVLVSIVTPEPTMELLAQITSKDGDKLLNEINKLNGWGVDELGFQRRSETPSKTLGE